MSFYLSKDLIKTVLVVASQHGGDGWQAGGSCRVCCVFGASADGHTRRKFIVGEGGVAVRSRPTDS